MKTLFWIFFCLPFVISIVKWIYKNINKVENLEREIERIKRIEKN